MRLGAVLGGLAKSLDEQLKDDMRRTEERSERIREYHVTRRQRREEREEEEARELQDVLASLASLVEDVDVPEGMTKADYAAQLYKAGGSTITGGKQLYTDLNTHRNLTGGSIKNLVTYADMKTGGRKVGDYINQFVRRPETAIKLPDELKGGVGFLSKVDVTKGIKDEMDAMFGPDTELEKFDIGQATIDRSQLVTAQEYARKKKQEEVAIQTAEVALEKQRKEIAQMGTLGSSDLRGFWSDFSRQHVEALGGSYDPDKKIWIAPKDRPDAVKKGMANALASLSRQAIQANNSHYKADVQAALAGYAGAAMVADAPENGKLEIGRVYATTINGVPKRFLHLGFDQDGKAIQPIVGNY